MENTYDYMGRRTSKTVNGTTTDFVYDGWNMIRDMTSSQTNHYVWGLDLSQSMQGAGGVGGLLLVDDGSGQYHATYDANGNVSEYVDTSSGTIAAHYEYDPFGNIYASTGPKKEDFAYRFSTKYFDAETGLSYYGYRYYNPELGRWLNRDPIGEISFIRHMLGEDIKFNLAEAYLGAVHVFLNNNPVGVWDLNGLAFDACGCIELEYTASHGTQLFPFGRTRSYPRWNGEPPLRPWWSLEYEIVRTGEDPCCEQVYNSRTIFVDLEYTPRFDTSRRRTHPHRLWLDRGRYATQSGVYEHNNTSGIIDTDFSAGTDVTVTIRIEGGAGESASNCGSKEFTVGRGIPFID